MFLFRIGFVTSKFAARQILSFNGGLPEIQTVSALRQSRQNFRNGFYAWFIARMLTIFNDGQHVVKINYCFPPELNKGGFKASKK